MTNEKIRALENKGFKRWTKGDKDRLYIKAWNLPNVKTIWKKNGKKCVEINGEELSYTKSSEVNYASIYIDLADDSIHVDSSFAEVLTEGVEMLLNSVSTTEETPAVKEDLTTEQTAEESKAEEKKKTDMEETKMMKVTKKGKALIEKNGGILKIIRLELAGNFDYSDCDNRAEFFEKWANEFEYSNFLEGWPKEMLLKDFQKVAYETTIDECIENGDEYGIARKFGYLEEIDED